MIIQTKKDVIVNKVISTQTYGTITIGRESVVYDAEVIIRSVSLTPTMEGQIAYAVMLVLSDNSRAQYQAGEASFTLDTTSKVPVLEQAYQSLLVAVGGELKL